MIYIIVEEIYIIEVGQRFLFFFLFFKIPSEVVPANMGKESHNRFGSQDILNVLS